MNQINWLSETNCAFPDANQALADPNGLLAVGGDLSVERLLAAYRQGIFPWYEADQPILWWSPDPRCVIEPATFTPSRSLLRRLKRGEFEIRVDTAFQDVISACRQRHGEIAAGTWITQEMKQAYIALSTAGYAHSVECFQDGALVGGLYGVSLGNLFFGESMFHRVTDASKVAFAGLMGLMQQVGCPLVDCQITNSHLVSLGAVEIPRDAFLNILQENVHAPPIDWQGFQGVPPISLSDRVLQPAASP